METPRIDVQPVVLEGEHVRLEPLTLAHTDAFHQAAQGDDIFTWMSEHPKTREDCERWIRRALDADDWQPFAIIERDGGRFIGSTSYLAIVPESRRLEIGWTWLVPEVRRSAVNTECKYLLLRHAFETLGCVRVELKTDGRNKRSQAAIMRIGAQYEGTFRKHQLIKDNFQRDSVWYSIIDDEWPVVKQRLEAMLGR